MFLTMAEFDATKNKIQKINDRAQRKGWTVREAERWLSPNLGYRTDDE